MLSKILVTALVMPELMTLQTLRGVARYGTAAIAAAALAGCTTTDAGKWELALDTSAGEDWQEGWFLEGNRASLENMDDGFIFSAGDELHDPASHAVLWSKQSFSGDIRIEYDYTRLDSMMDATSVNILYIQATGIGGPDNPVDILRSTRDRQVPWMRSYFLGMNLLHISYAASGPERSNYVSARRYPASSRKSFDSDTQIPPVYEDVNLFRTGVTYHVTATKEGDSLNLVVENDGTVTRFSWDTSRFARITSGRVGLRHMWGRSSRYQNLRIYVKDQIT